MTQSTGAMGLSRIQDEDEFLARDPHYREAIEYLNSFQFHGFRLGLERMERILAALGAPERSFQCIHIAGTNGKGSVSATLSSILTAAGLRVGLYTSPHLVSVRERFRVCETEISPEEFTKLAGEIRGLVEAGYELSYFEYTTVLAFLWFRMRGVAIAILETGLGGRLDATNVVTPLVSVITNVAWDHEKYLGRTLREIAKEKAGIIKPGVPVVNGAVDGEPGKVVRETCQRLAAPLRELGREFCCTCEDGGSITYKGKGRRMDGIRPILAGGHQVRNLSLALATCEVLQGCGIPIGDEAVRQGCASVRWPCRCEFLEGERTVLLDGAHNPDGAAALRAFLDRIYATRPLGALLFAATDEGGGKDVGSMIETLSPPFEQVVITEPPGPRAPVTLEGWRQIPLSFPFVLERDWRLALDRALGACGPERVLCVSGSLYLAGRVRAELIRRGYQELRERDILPVHGAH
ncbi:MAG: bifunctional folylpolyglutamate synthase/dihydrofolate synthase [Deltaproteobacteria bacterium]